MSVEPADPAAESAAAVLIGRFQPFHRGHQMLLQQALAVAPCVVVVLGSAHQARSVRNPFTWTERAGLIAQAAGAADRARLRFLPMRDLYDGERWAAQLRLEVARLLADRPGPVRLVGHFKDASSAYLRDFPDWRLLTAPAWPGADGTALRDALFDAAAAGVAGVPAALAALATQLPPTTQAFLADWVQRPVCAELVEEWQQLRRERAAWAAAPYPPVFVTVDAVVRCADRVLLIRRGRAPGKGLLATPGGFIEPDESLWQAAVRELVEETGVAGDLASWRAALRVVQVFDHPRRSQRGRVITHAHGFDLGDGTPPPVRGGDDAAVAQWCRIDRLADWEDRFHDDHFHLLQQVLARLRG